MEEKTYKSEVIKKHPRAYCKFNEKMDWYAIFAGTLPLEDFCICTVETTEEDAWRKAYNFTYKFSFKNIKS